MKKICGFIIILLFICSNRDISAGKIQIYKNIAVESFFTKFIYNVKINNKNNYNEFKSELNNIIDKEKMDVSAFAFDDNLFSINIGYDWEMIVSLFEKTKLNEYLNLSMDYIDISEDYLSRKKGINVSRIISFKDAQEKLLKEANSFFSENKFEYKKNKITTDLNLPFSEINKKVINKIFKNNKGISIGEVHTHKENSRKFLMNNMEIFKNVRVKFLFIEGIDYKLQSLIDAYMNSEKKEIPYEIKCNLSNSYIKILENAKKNEIRVVGIDTDLARTNCKQLNMIKRLKLFNFFASKIIKNVLSNASKYDKYIIYSGQKHVCNSKKIPGFYNIDEKKILPGFSEILSVKPLLLMNIIEKKDNIINSDLFFKKEYPYYTYYEDKLVCVLGKKSNNKESLDYKKMMAGFYLKIKTFEEIEASKYENIYKMFFDFYNTCARYAKIGYFKNKTKKWRKQKIKSAIKIFNSKEKLILSKKVMKVNMNFKYIFILLAKIDSEETLKYLKIFIPKLYEKNKNYKEVIESLLKANIWKYEQHEQLAELCGSIVEKVEESDFKEIISILSCCMNNVAGITRADLFYKFKLTFEKENHLKIIEDVLCNYIRSEYEKNPIEGKTIPVNALRTALNVSFYVEGRDSVIKFDLKDDCQFEIIKKIALTFFKKQHWSSRDIQCLDQEGWLGSRIDINNKKHLDFVLEMWKIVNYNAIPEYVLSQLDPINNKKHFDFITKGISIFVENRLQNTSKSYYHKSLFAKFLGKHFDVNKNFTENLKNNLEFTKKIMLILANIDLKLFIDTCGSISTLRQIFNIKSKNYEEKKTLNEYKDILALYKDILGIKNIKDNNFQNYTELDFIKCRLKVLGFSKIEKIEQKSNSGLFKISLLLLNNLKQEQKKDKDKKTLAFIIANRCLETQILKFEEKVQDFLQKNA